MNKKVSIKQFFFAIYDLPSDKPKDTPGKWYKTQKEHWLGWLGEYKGPGAYGRKGGKDQGAEYAYNHIVEYRMLLWLIEAAGVESKLVKAAKSVVCSQCHGDKSYSDYLWVHDKHVTSKLYDCSFCHNFSRATERGLKMTK